MRGKGKAQVAGGHLKVCSSARMLCCSSLLQCADEKEVVMQVAGLNHFIFVRQILHKGKNGCRR